MTTSKNIQTTSTINSQTVNVYPKTSTCIQIAKHSKKVFEHKCNATPNIGSNFNFLLFFFL